MKFVGENTQAADCNIILRKTCHTSGINVIALP